MRWSVPSRSSEKLQFSSIYFALTMDKEHQNLHDPTGWWICQQRKDWNGFLILFGKAKSEIIDKEIVAFSHVIVGIVQAGVTTVYDPSADLVKKKRGKKELRAYSSDKQQPIIWRKTNLKKKIQEKFEVQVKFQQKEEPSCRSYTDRNNCCKSILRFMFGYAYGHLVADDDWQDRITREMAHRMLCLRESPEKIKAFFTC